MNATCGPPKFASQGVELMLQRTHGALDPRFLRTRRAIVDSLIRLLKDRPFENISIREITTGAKIGYATFYRHYSSKESLFTDVLSSQIAKLIEDSVPLVFGAGMRQSFTLVCGRILDNKEVWRGVMTGAAAGMFREEFVRQSRKITQRFAGFRSPLPEDLHLACVTGLTVDVLTWWLQQEDMCSLEEIVDLLDRMIGVTSPLNVGAPAYAAAVTQTV